MNKYVIFVIGLVIISVIQVMIATTMGGVDMLLAIGSVVVGAILILALFVFIMQPMLSQMKKLEAAKRELDEIRREQEKKRDKTVHPVISD